MRHGRWVVIFAQRSIKARRTLAATKFPEGTPTSSDPSACGDVPSNSARPFDGKIDVPNRKRRTWRAARASETDNARRGFDSIASLDEANRPTSHAEIFCARIGPSAKTDFCFPEIPTEIEAMT
jgi:hypothetical protein